jgi:hypothetical protein
MDLINHVETIGYVFMMVMFAMWVLTVGTGLYIFRMIFRAIFSRKSKREV